MTHQNLLEERLQQIRAKIETSGEAFLNRDELEKELASRLGGV